MSYKHNLHRLNPNWEQATTHGIASRTGKVKHFSSVDETMINEYNQNICHCCHQPIVKQHIDIFANSKQLQFLGFGFPLFYEFLKFCIILMVVLIGTYSAISLHQGLQHNYALCHTTTADHTASSLSKLGSVTSTSQENASASETPTVTSTQTTELAAQCYTFMINIARIQSEWIPQQQAARIISFVIQALVLIYIRSYMVKLQAYYDQRSTTLSDYAIFIKGITIKQGIGKSVKQFIQQIFLQSKKDITEVVHDIILLPDFQHIQKLQQERQKVIAKLKPFYNDELMQTEQAQLLQKQANTIHDKILEQAKGSYDLIAQDKMECQRVIVVFQRQKYKQKALTKFKQLDKSFLEKYFGNQVYAKQAPNPQEIIWENVNLPKRKRILRFLLGWVLGLVTLVAVFVVFYFILVEKSYVLERATQQLHGDPTNQQYLTEYRGAIALVFILMFLVVLFDKIVLASLFHWFTDLEKHSNEAKLQFSFSLKLALGLFFTTALMTLAVQAIKFKNYYSHLYGVVDQQTIMFFMNSFFVPFFWLVNPFRIAKWIKRKIQYGKTHLTQLQANKLMEQSNYDLGKRYAQILQMVWFVYLYATLMPIGACITCAGFIFYYWVDKFNLLRRSRIECHVSSSHLNHCLTMLDFTLILKPIGSIIFDTHIRYRNYETSNIIMIVLAFVFIIFPKTWVINKLNAQEFEMEQKTYDQAKHLFKKNYYTQHPLYCVLRQQDIEQHKLQQKMARLNSLKFNTENKLKWKSSHQENEVPTKQNNGNDIYDNGNGSSTLLRRGTDTSDIQFVNNNAGM